MSTMTDTRGFTLLETLVALVVLSFVVLGLAEGLRFGLTAWDHQAAIMNQDGALDATDRALQSMLATMVPGADPRVPTIQGSANRLAFTSRLPTDGPGAPRRLVDVVLGVDAAHRLVIGWAPHWHARVLAPPATHEEVLLTGVAAMTLRYFARAGAHQAAGWVTQWRSAEPPELVRLHLAFTDPALRWPDLIVAPVQQANEE